ncbi:TonB-dependent siderophore receptor [uncultured Psychrobacter sp.]|uniref:TonB-dependent siderophore receptor n=1 Tax=uncultured Psychrobacter sp. TaxID=259303 RepID=UPI0034587420
MPKSRNHTRQSVTTPARTSITTRRKSSLSTLLMMASAVPLSSLSNMANAASVDGVSDISGTPSNYSSANVATNDALPSTTLEALTVTAEPDADFKEDYLANTKYIQPLVDTPQTITVITDELIEEQKANSLIDALRNTPGITMQMGENANSNEGDAISMRGFSGNSLFLVDGVRNVAPVSRDTFNVESIEVTKGLAGAELGRGAVGGAINIVTKKPKAYTEYETEISVDTEAKTRFTADLNQPLNEDFDGRLNLMFEKGDMVKRDEVDIEKYGIAPSITWGADTPTRVTASAQLLRARDTPESGIPTIGMDGYFRGPTDATVDDFDFSQLDYSLIDASTPEEAVDLLNRGNALLNAAPKVDEENYYGNRDDYDDVDSDVYSVFIEHDIDDNTYLTNTTRYARTTMDRRTSSPYLTYNTPLNIRRGGNILEAYESLANANIDINNRDTWRIGAIRQGVDRKNETFANLTNINILDVKTGSLSHDITTGVEFLKEQQENNVLTYSSLGDNFPNLYNPDPSMPQTDLVRTGATTKGETKTMAAYLFDTVALNEQWDVMLGGRVDNYDTDFEENLADGSSRDLSDGGTLFSYKGAVVYKPTINSSVYANYGRAETPPGSENFTFGTTGRDETNPNANPVFDPQKTNSWEIGTKWNVLDERLLLGLSYYHTKHKDELAEADDNGNYIQFGEREVKGIEFSAQGEITPDWRVNLGIQTMDTEITDGGANSSRYGIGSSARWSPDLTGTLWTSYDYSEKFTFGGGVRYVDEQKRLTDPNVDTSETPMPVIPDYWAVDAFASYRINDALSADLNVYNLFDEDYIDSLNIQGVRAVKGEPLNAMVTLRYLF